MMFQTVLVLAAICNAFAFAPTGAMRSTRSMHMSTTEKMVGASIEVNGGVFAVNPAKYLGTLLLRVESVHLTPSPNVVLTHRHRTLQARSMTHLAC